MGELVSMLDRPVYGYAEVDRLLRLTPGTTKRWVDGYERAGKWYDPVIREQRSDSPWVSWGEFVETRLLAEFRPTIPMLRLRPAVQRLRDYFGYKNPLAYAAPFLSRKGKELLLRVQDESALDRELWIALLSGQEVLLTPAAMRFTQAAHFPDETGPADYVTADPATPEVRLSPQVREGQPAVGGIRSQTLAELVTAGEPVSFVAETYDLPVGAIEQALTYEATRRRAA
jgi:uncharacterized protein (DUF433 family)